ncbi:hypothetical protein K457DRAFT_1911315 [Linnemannia elongata AG-77]|uniref:RNI-like protein n=1 Tax=Linnemannia elongata AG-77 TaxID=1314771 RepID=A0A197JF34_9FUNG|nr:hypothetical protein K457DRAFT_1911315 [Linnemannia elongata AG-77]
MSNNDMSQQLRHGNDTYYFQVYPGTEETQGVPFVLLKDIQALFPNASNVMCGRHVISFMHDAHYASLMPLRFAYRPNMIIEIAGTEPSMSSSEVLPESSHMPSSSPRTGQHFSAMSHRQLTRQNTAVLQSTSATFAEKSKFQQSAALFEDFIKAIQNGQKEHADVIRGDFQKGYSSLQAALDRNHNLQQQLNNMQQLMLQMQQQALDRLAVIQGRIQALLTQTYELHEYPIPRLFIILPKDTSTFDSASLFNKQFQLYFLCECGEHTRVLNGNNTSIPHHIHIAKHEGYDLRRPTEVFQRYGRYMLTLLEMIKHGSTIAGYFVPALSAVNVSGAIDMVKSSQDTISPTAVNQSIEYLQSLTSKDSEEQDPAKDTTTDSFTGREALEGADLRHLEAFLKSKDQHRALGNLYRTITQDGHVKWVCINHYRLGYKERDQEAFATAVELNGGHYDPHLGRVTVSLGSKIQAAGFFDALAKAKRVDELIVIFNWEGIMSDLETFGDILKSANISILRLDLRRFRASFSSKLLPTSTRQQVLARLINLPSMKIIHIVLPISLFKLASLKPTGLSPPPRLSFGMALGPGDRMEIGKIVEKLKTNSTLTTLDLFNNSIGDSGAVVLSKALKTNSTLTTLDLSGNSIGDKGAVALSEALKTNSTMTTLDLSGNSIGDKGAVALFEALKTNSTLITLDLWSNSIGDNGAVALFEALKTNSTMTTLDLSGNSIRENGVLALSEALKTNSALTTLDLSGNSIGDNGAVALYKLCNSGGYEIPFRI